LVYWSKGRGILGPLRPLLGRWSSVAPHGRSAGLVLCRREFQAFGSHYIRLDAAWNLDGRDAYREVAFFGRNDDGRLAFWSFTSDGKRSSGFSTDGRDIHAQALAFVAEMPAGLARMVYWPADDGSGFEFAVERRAKSGWSRFIAHRYRPERTARPSVAKATPPRSR
jgi:hypothetical protein